MIGLGLERVAKGLVMSVTGVDERDHGDRNRCDI